MYSLHFTPGLNVTLRVGLIHLTWNPVSGVKEYDVYIYSNEDDPEDRKPNKTVYETTLQVSLIDVKRLNDFFMEASMTVNSNK